MDQTLAAEPVASPIKPRPKPSQRLSELAGPARVRLQVAGLCNALSGIGLIAQAALVAGVVQSALVELADPASLLPSLWGLLGIGLLRTLLSWIGRELADSATSTILLALRRTLSQRLLSAGVPWLRRQRSGALSELTGRHVEALDAYYASFVPIRTEVVVVPLAILIAVFSVDWVVGVILLVTMPAIPLFMMLVGWGAEAASRRQLQALTRLGGHFADRLRGLGLIRLYGRGEAELQGIAEASEELRERSMRVLRIAFMSSAVLEFFASVAVALVAVYLGLTHLEMMDMRGGAPLTLGVSLFCLLLAPEYYGPMRRLAAHYHDRAGALAALEEIEQAFGQESERMGAAERGRRAGRAPSLQLENLGLRHHRAQTQVLSGLELSIASGEIVALVGASGCGKSTLLETIAGWMPADGGHVRIDPGSARIGYAPQRPHLFHGSIADNLRLARPDASDEQLLAAADAAQLTTVIQRLPDGLETMIGERGFGLSGGEARRLALARVYLRDTDLLLLDEPTAFLDPQTESALLAALAGYAKGRTVIIATHSEAVMAMANRVVRLSPLSAATGASA